MLYRTLFFDLDDTLYPHTAGLWEAIRHRMDFYMVERLGLTEEAVAPLRAYYLETYGTTLRGLQNHYHVDAQDFLAYVHDLPLEQFLLPNPALSHVLSSLPQQRWIFTNADIHHARRVLAVIGLTQCFHGIIDVNALNFVPKPDPQAYLQALALAQADVKSSIIFDDAARNLRPAVQLGFTTVLVAPEPVDGFSIHLTSLDYLPQIMPILWQR